MCSGLRAGGEDHRYKWMLRASPAQLGKASVLFQREMRIPERDEVNFARTIGVGVLQYLCVERG